MFVITIHNCSGSLLDAAEATRAYLYSTYADAEQACDLINRLLEKDGEDYAFITPINEVAAIVTNPPIAEVLQGLKNDYEL